MTKPLSEMLEGMEPCTCDAQFSGRDEAEYRARGCPGCICAGPMFQRVAIELAKACETTAIMDNDCGRWCKRSLSRAKDIIGGE